MLRIVLPLLVFCLQCPGQYSLPQLAEADAILVGRVASVPAEAVRVPLREGKDSVPHTDLAMGIYEVEVLQTIKGDAAGRLKVMAACSDPKQIEHRGAASEAYLGMLPPGERMLLLLRSARDGLILRAPSLEGGEYFDAPPGVEYSVLDFWQCQRHYVVPDSAPERFPLKGDYVARDVARVLARSTAVKPDARARITAQFGFDRLVLWPPAAQLTRVPKVPLPEDRDPDAPYRALLGPDPYRFYVEEIAPVLPPVTGDTSPLEMVSRWRVAGSWGDPHAAKRIVDAALELDPKNADPALASALAGAVSGLFQYPNGEENAARAIRSPLSEVVLAALPSLHGVPGPGRPKYADHVKALLDHPDPEVVRGAMVALAAMYDERDKQPNVGAMGDTSFDPGSRNAELLEYWRNKQ